MKIIGQKIELAEHADCCAPEGLPDNTIRIETRDGGAGPYAVVATRRWAFDSREEWLKLWDVVIAPMLDKETPKLDET